MSLFQQHLLPLENELIVDLFAGGGGASSGIEEGLGRMVNIAINHDHASVQLHAANHPLTDHHLSDVFEVDPRIACGGKPVGILWASPDCTYHSKARGSKPIRHANQKRRALAWVVTRWAGQVKPRVIMLENVEEFAQWGPLVAKKEDLSKMSAEAILERRLAGIRRRVELVSTDKKAPTEYAALRTRTAIEDQHLIPCQARRSKSFRRWVASLEAHGYVVEWRELRGADYGAPTIRKRLFLIARCDGQPIVWPEQTHMNRHKFAKLPTLKRRGMKAWRSAASQIDFTLPMCSIFADKPEAKAFADAHGLKGVPQRPLKPNTMTRIARGVKRFVLDSAKPFILPNGILSPVVAGVGGRAGQSLERGPEDPGGTTTAKADQAVVAPYAVTIAHADKSKAGAKRWGFGAKGLEEPLGAVTGKGETAVGGLFMVPRYGEREGQQPRTRSTKEPAGTITPANNDGQVTAVALSTYYGGQAVEEGRGRDPRDPITVIPTENRHGVVGIGFLPVNADGNSAGHPGKDPEEPLSTSTGKGANQSVAAVWLRQGNAGFMEGGGRKVEDPLGTVLTESRGHHSLMAMNMVQSNHGDKPFSEADDPLRTVVAGGNHHAVTGTELAEAAFVGRDFGQSVGSDLHEPIGTVMSTGNGKAHLIKAFLEEFNGMPEKPRGRMPKEVQEIADRYDLITVKIKRTWYFVVDICMRMLTPRELYNCQGFRHDYIIDRGADGTPISLTDQVRMCGNSVCPPVVSALVRANCPEMVVRIWKRGRKAA